MKFKHTGRVAFGLAAAVTLSACSYGNVGPAENQTEATSRDVARYIDAGRHPLVPENIERIRSDDGVWTGSIGRRNDHGSVLPRNWERPDGFVLKRATTMQIFEIGSAITEITSIPLTFSPDVMAQSGGVAPVAAGPTGNTTQQGGANGDLNSLLGGLGLGGGNSGGPSANAANIIGNQIRPITSTRQAMRVEFQGRLSQFLNQMSAHFGVSWEYSAGEIHVFRNVTRTFTVNALPSNINVNATLSADSSTQQAAGGQGGQSGGGAASAANQKISSTTNISIWDDIAKNVDGIVGGQGRVTSSVSTGTITVTAPSGIIQRVQTYLDGQNERLSKQVTVNVTVLSVELKDGDNTSLDIGGLFNDAGKFGLAFGTPAGVASGTTAIATLANAALAAVSGTTASAIPTGVQVNPLANSSMAAGGVGFNVANPRSAFNGSNVIAQALATKGRVSLRTNASVTTINGVPAPVQVSNTRGYVPSVSVSDGTTSGSATSTTRTSIQSGSVTTGFSMSLTPRIDPDGQSVLMQYNINLSELVGAVNGFETFTSPDGKATVQLPNVNSRNFVQQARVPNGATLVLTGFEQTSNSADRQGSLGDASFLGLGGHQVGQRNRTAIVILMTPTVVSNQVVTAE